jgi:D-inositol-3-phosphate glycosyltransferase
LVSEHASPLALPGGRESGGQNVYVAGLAGELARRGLDVTVYTRRDAPDLAERVPFAPGVAVEHVNAGPPRGIPRDAVLPHMGDFARALHRSWSAQPPDVVHAHYWMSGIAALDACRRLDIPLVQTFHALGVVKRRVQHEHDTSPPERIPSEVCLARAASAVVATSHAELEELTAIDATPRHAQVIPCGVCSQLFSPDGPSEQSGGRPRMVVVGRLIPRKGVDDVIQALRLLPEVQLAVVGGSGPADPDAVRLRAVAAHHGVADRVEFRGPVGQQALPAVLRAAGLMVCVPWYEPFGIVALEAMACALPVVASAVGGLRETIVDGATGVLVPPRDPARLAEAAGALLNDPARRAALGRAGRRRACRLYDWRRIGDKVVALYGDVLAGAADRHAVRTRG